MCMLHLSTRPFDTELSSWASSLQVAFSFARHTERATHSYISIIDTKELKNPVYFVPSLKGVLGSWCVGYSHEYLAHGVISGPAHKAVQLHHMMAIGYPKDYARQTAMRLGQSVSTLDTTAAEFRDAQGVAKLYGPKFGTAVMIAILTLKQRDGMLWRNGTHGAERKFNRYILDAGFEVPGDLCEDSSILTDNVYTDGYGCVEQMIRMLRAITNLNHGRGARVKRPSCRARDIILDEEREAERRRTQRVA